MGRHSSSNCSQCKTWTKTARGELSIFLHFFNYFKQATPWMTSRDVNFHQNSSDFSVSNGSLSLASHSWTTGSDIFGHFAGLQQVVGVFKHYKTLISRHGRHQMAQLRSPPHSDPTLALLVSVAQMDQKALATRVGGSPTKTGAKERQSFPKTFLKASLVLLSQMRMQSKMDFDYRENFQLFR